MGKMLVVGFSSLFLCYFGLYWFLMNKLKFPAERMCKSTGFSHWLLELGKLVMQDPPPPHSLKLHTAFANEREELCVLFKVFYASSITRKCLHFFFGYTFKSTPLCDLINSLV